MGSRIDIDNFDSLLAIARKNMVDGIIAGERFAVTIIGILVTASAFGGDEAELGRTFHATVDVADFDELKRVVVATAFDDLFGPSNLDRIVRDVCLAGAAFGFQNITAQMRAKEAAL